MAFASLEAHAGDAGPRAKEDAKSFSPGAILSERSRDLGNGYREVHRSQVNPPGHWEGVGHFAFVFFKDEPLCQCDSSEIAVSPDGNFAIYTNVQDGKLMLFRASQRTRKQLSDEFIGYPKGAAWDLPARRVVVTLEKYENGVGKVHKLAVPF